MSGTLSLEDFRQRIQDSLIKCRMPGCTWKGHAIDGHLELAHQMTSGQYRKSYPDAKLASPIVATLMRRMDRKPKDTDDLQDLIVPFEADMESPHVFMDFARNFKPDPALATFIPEEVKHFHFDPAATKGLCTALALGMNTYIEGPTGCGKTELAYQVHNRLKLPMERINMNGDATAASFIGHSRVDPTRGTFFEYGMAPRCMKAGMTLVLDEIDYCPPHIAATLNSILEGKRTLYIHETGETIVAKKGFCVVATANTGGKGDATGVYTGVEILNTAHLDRYPMKLKMGYLPEKVEIAMLEARFPNAQPASIKLLVQAAGEARVAFEKGDLVLTVSTRKLIDYFTLQPLLGEVDALKSTVLNWLDDDDLALVTEIFKRKGVKVPE